ncbi:LLM class flavin-dependent oxidoreductase [Bacillus massiliigorillae]|uniref:LLM class flavin-dependent oxidoreductase n=1 Tax=Bacillus massiliigorillae TaxID=1243664 RepID=UPI0003A28C49|nr:LLM class flavin-dependent oxidoreductase [Bacillus massiliigorillae]
MVEFITMAPTSGDSEYVGAVTGDSKNVNGWTGTSEGADRKPTLKYIKAVAQAAEKGGFSTLLLPTGGNCLDSLVVASHLAAYTERINYLFAVRPGFTAPAIFANQFATLDYWSKGRAQVNIVTGGSSKELASDGDTLEHSNRYHRTREFIDVLNRLFTEDEFDYNGEFYQLKGAHLARKPLQKPEIFFGGSSAIAKDVASDLADVYMLWGETLENTKQQIDEVKRLAEQKGRVLSYSVSFQVVLGETEEQAWANAEKLISKADPTLLTLKNEQMQKGEAVGVKRLHDLMASTKENNFVIAPNLWAGLTQVLSGNSIALVGSADQVAQRIVEYVELGVDKILLRGFPHLETIEQVGELIIPRVRALLANKQAV